MRLLSRLEGDAKTAMSVDIVKQVVADFLSNKEPGVLVIKGAWGVGKTHMWNAILTANRDALKIPQYSYVSLFGQKSVSDLRTALVAKTIPSKYIGKSFDWETINREWTGLVKPAVKRLAAWANKIRPAIPHVKDVSVSFDSIAGFLLNDAIICLDDWERTNIPLDELLGFVSELKIERDCKVVLIFNDGKLTDDQKRVFREYREKVVDIELVFQPTAREAADIAVAPSTPHASLLLDKITALEIKNIRLIGRILGLVKILEAHIKTTRKEIQEQVVTTAVLMTWLHYGEDSPGKPSIEFVRKWNNLGSAHGALPGAKLSEEERTWGSILNGYGYASTDELDLAVDQVIERGYWQGTELVDQLKALERSYAAAEGQRSFEQAWDVFHGSFRDNEQEVIDALSAGLRSGVKFVTPLNLNGTISVLRQLKKDKLADDLIEYYVEHRKSESEIFNLEDSPFGEEVTDKRIRERFAEVNVVNMDRPSLFDAVTNAREKKGWSREAQQVMTDATVDDIYAAIMADNGAEAGRDFVRACEWLSAVNGNQEFRKKFVEALTRVADSSPLNAARVRRYGVAPSIKGPLSAAAQV